MNNFGEQINIVINNISEKLGIAVEKLYPALVKQAYIEGFINLVWFITDSIIFYIMLKCVIRWFRNPEKKDDGTYSWEKGYTGLFITKVTICLCLLPILFILICANFNDSIQALLNPNWYMIQKIISQIK